jgi:apolipoprotein N-acyltransferase
MRAEAGEPDEPLRYYNSILALGADAAFYDKRQLVPFGEFLPVPSFVRRWLRLMELPADDFTVGEPHQQPFALAGTTLAASICYEAAYPGLLRRETRQAGAMVSVSNDGWFGRSPARYLHLQIGRMRALEAQRYLLRAANDGVSAIVGPDGRIQARAPEFEPAVLRGEFTPRRGATPYLAAGNWPLLGLLAALLAARAGALIWRSRDPIQRN